MNDTKQPEYGPRALPNDGRHWSVEYQGVIYERIPVRLPFIGIGEEIVPKIRDYVVPHLHTEDFITISEKIVALSQKRVIHRDEVTVTSLARLVCKFTTKYTYQTSFGELPEKMQVAINQSGYLRTVIAITIGGIMKFIFKKPGWFWRIMGKQASGVDGFNPDGLPKLRDYAILTPRDPDGYATKMSAVFGAPVAIMDANDMGIEVLGTSPELADQHALLVGALAGNPAGQGHEQTPVVILRKAPKEHLVSPRT